MANFSYFNYNISLTGDSQNNSSGAMSIDIYGQFVPPVQVVWQYPDNFTYVITGVTNSQEISRYTRTNLSAGTYIFSLVESKNPMFFSASSTVLSANNISFIVNSSTTVNLSVSAGTSCSNSNGILIAQTSNVYDSVEYELYKDNVLYESITSNTSAIAITGLSEGMYYVTVNNGGISSISDTVLIDSSPSLNFGLYTINAPACYFRGGRIIVTGLTGTPPYTYGWSADSVQWGITPTGDTATGLTSGNFIVTVTDSVGCSLSKNVTLDTSYYLSLVTSLVTSPTCNSNNGELYYVISGGSPPYFYQLSNGDNVVTNNQSVTFTGLSSGNYTLNVTDAGLCRLTNTQFITTPNVFTTLSVSKTDSKCSFNDGTVVATVQGGSPPYTYTIHNSDSGYSQSQVSFIAQNKFTNLSSDTYTVRIKDKSNLCEYSETVTINNITPFDFTLTQTDTTCGYRNGTVTVNVTPSLSSSTLFQYTLSNGFTSAIYSATSYTFSGLSPDTYSLTVLDVNNKCRQTKSIYVNSSAPPNLFLSSTECLQGSGGTISALIQGTTGKYNLTWSDNVNGQSGIFLTGLTAGTYTLTLSGDSGCIYNASTTISCNPVKTSTLNYSLVNAIQVNNVPTITQIQTMAFSGYSNLVENYEDCLLNSAQVNLLVNIGFDEYVFPYYLITDLNTVPSYSEYINFVKISIESIPFILSCSVNEITNTITIVSETINNVEYYKDENISLSVRIDYDINCGSLDECPCANLVLKLDASNPNSYPGYGNTWFDLSSQSNNAIITGTTIAYTGDYGGGVILNDNTSNDGYLQLPISTLNLNEIAINDSYTVVIAFRKDYFSNTNNGTSSLILGGTNGLTLGWRLIESSTGTTFGNFDNNYKLSFGSPGNNPVTYSLESDVCLGIITKDGTNLTALINGNNYSNEYPSVYQSGANVGHVGKNGFGVGSLNGSLFLLYIYSKALTSSQMNTVYNSLKGRFEL